MRAEWLGQANLRAVNTCQPVSGPDSDSANAGGMSGSQQDTDEAGLGTSPPAAAMQRAASAEATPDRAGQSAAAVKGSSQAVAHQPAPSTATADSGSAAQTAVPSWLQLRARMAHIFSPEAESSGAAGTRAGSADAELQPSAPIADRDAAEAADQVQVVPSAQLPEQQVLTRSQSASPPIAQQASETAHPSAPIYEPGTSCHKHLNGNMTQQPCMDVINDVLVCLSHSLRPSNKFLSMAACVAKRSRWSGKRHR